jgi:formamidopyrimidine-DNA glycosylase
MPELPEVETILRGLRLHALGRRVTRVEVLSPTVIVGSAHAFATAIKGRWIKAFHRKGKALAIELGGRKGETSYSLVVRLGMTGQFRVAPREAPVEAHTHVRLVLGGGSEELRYRDVRRFGRLRCCTCEELEEILNRLGPDAREITEAEFRAALRGRRGAIKSWLMNQQLLSGVGNIYADEALFAARIHPLTPAGKIPALAARRLHRAVRKVLARAIALGGTSFSDFLDAEGRSGRFRQRLRVYQRTEEPCRRCRQPIRRIVVAGRSTHFCPRCQRRPRRVAVVRRPRASQAPRKVRRRRKLAALY